jgi:hypothetical protein
MSLDVARAAPERDARAPVKRSAHPRFARSKRSAVPADAMMADAVGVRPSKQGARSGRWRGPAPRMARGSSNLADESKPVVAVANI